VLDCNNRRSSRVTLSIPILVSGIHPTNDVRFEAEAETLVVNKHGALIRTLPGLQSGTPLRITVPPNGKSANSRVIWDAPRTEGRYGVELETPENLWQVLFPPPDW